jgi:hypothetical protein
MDSNRKVESIFIASLIVLTIGLGIVCSLYDMNTVVSSVCFAIGITSLVYWFLGGISDASFNMGYLKLGGSIAALLGSFYLINEEMKEGMVKCQGIDLVGSQVLAMDMNTGSPASLMLMHGGDTINDLLPSDYKKKKFAQNSLTLGDKLEVLTDQGYALGRLDNEILRKKHFFNKIANSTDPGELYKFRLLETKTFSRLNLTISATSFRNDGYAEFKMQSTKNKSITTSFFIDNKGMKVVNLEGVFYLITATQAVFSNKANKDDFYIQLFIKPLIVE